MMSLSAIQRLTLEVLAAAVAVLGAFDVVVAFLRGRRATISWVISSISTRVPFIPFVFGVLMGHFFAQDANPTL